MSDYIQTPGIVMRLVKTVKGRRIVGLFTRTEGKISAGTYVNEAGKSRSALAIRPFAYGSYGLKRSRGYYSIQNAEVIRSHYGLAGDVDKLMVASYALEFTDRLLHEDEPAEALFDELVCFFSMLEERTRSFGTLLAGYMSRAITWSGCAPALHGCTLCGGSKGSKFSVEDGGLVCESCRAEIFRDSYGLFDVDRELLDVFEYLLCHPVEQLEKLALREDLDERLRVILRAYAACHLGIEELKSESLIV